MFLVLSLLSALLVSCTDRQPEAVVAEPQPLPFAFDESLVLCDSLLQHDADSAMMCLTSLRPTEGSGEISHTFNANYQSLLISEALYKTDNPQYYRSDLQDAMRCFDSLYAVYPANDDLAMLAARSHYMNGVGFYEDDSVVDACREYLKTLEIMEDHFGVETSQGTALQGYKAKFMGLTYNRLVDLFSDQFMMEPAIYCGKKSLHYCKIKPTSKYGIANVLSGIGTNYYILGNIDSTYLYYNSALEALPDSNNFIYRNITSSIAILSYDMSKTADKALSVLKENVRQTDNESERIARYIGIGYIYYNEKVYDSAIIYLKNVLEHTTESPSFYQSADYMHKIYQIIGDTVKSNEYAEIMAEITSSKYDNMMTVASLDQLFNDYLNKKPLVTHYQKDKRNVILTIAIFIVFVSIIVIISRIRSHKMIKDNNEKSQQKLEEEWRKHQNENNSLKHSIKKTEQQVVKLKKELGIKHFEAELRREALLNEPVCRKICSMVENLSISARDNYYKYKLSLSDDLIAELHSAVLKHSEKFDTILLGKCPSLKQNDLLLCYLLLLGLNEKQVAILRNRSYSAIKKQIEKVKLSLRIDKDLSDFIIKIM